MPDFTLPKVPHPIVLPIRKSLIFLELGLEWGCIWLGIVRLILEFSQYFKLIIWVSIDINMSIIILMITTLENTMRWCYCNKSKKIFYQVKKSSFQLIFYLLYFYFVVQFNIFSNHNQYKIKDNTI